MKTKLISSKMDPAGNQTNRQYHRFRSQTKYNQCSDGIAASALENQGWNHSPFLFGY